MPDRLQDIRARLRAATPWPWEWQGLTEEECAEASVRFFQPHMMGSVRGTDTEFIAHAPADIAWCVSEIERLRAKCGEDVRSDH